MPTAITSSGITFDDATTQTTSATKAGGIGTTQLADAAVTPAKLSGAQSGSAPIYGARAWVNFNGTGTPAIRESGNVSSITDLGVGIFRINFTTAMPSANFASASFGSLDGITSSTAVAIGFVAAATTSLTVSSRTTANTNDDFEFIHAVVFV